MDELRGIYCGVNVVHNKSSKFKKPLVIYDDIYRINKEPRSEENDFLEENPILANASRIIARLAESEGKAKGSA